MVDPFLCLHGNMSLIASKHGTAVGEYVRLWKLNEVYPVGLRVRVGYLYYIFVATRPNTYSFHGRVLGGPRNQRRLNYHLFGGDWADCLCRSRGFGWENGEEDLQLLHDAVVELSD